jgi:hypothetical protein
MGINIKIPVPRYRQPEIDRLQNTINSLNRQIDSLNGQIRALSDIDGQVQTNIGNARTSISDLNTQIAGLIAQKKSLIASLSQAEYELQMLRESNILNNTHIDTGIQQASDLANATISTKTETQMYTQNFFDNIRRQTTDIQKSHGKTVYDYQTSNSKEVYQTEQTNYIRDTNFYLFLCYYFLLFALTLVLFFIQKTMTLFKKIQWITVLAIYPFFIMFIETMFSYFLQICLNLIQTKIPS